MILARLLLNETRITDSSSVQYCKRNYWCTFFHCELGNFKKSEIDLLKKTWHLKTSKSVNVFPKVALQNRKICSLSPYYIMASFTIPIKMLYCMCPLATWRCPALICTVIQRVSHCSHPNFASFVCWRPKQSSFTFYSSIYIFLLRQYVHYFFHQFSSQQARTLWSENVPDPKSVMRFSDWEWTSSQGTYKS